MSLRQEERFSARVMFRTKNYLVGDRNNKRYLIDLQAPGFYVIGWLRVSRHFRQHQRWFIEQSHRCLTIKTDVAKINLNEVAWLHGHTFTRSS